MGVFNFTNKDFTGGNLLLDADEYLAIIDNVFEEPKKKKPTENNTVIDFKILGRVTPEGIQEDNGDGIPFEEYRPVRNWYSAPWTILPLLVAFGVNVTPGTQVEVNNDTLKGQKIYLTIKQETIQGDNGPRVVNKIEGYRPFVVA